jgi:hypothetical protein
MLDEGKPVVKIIVSRIPHHNMGRVHYVVLFGRLIFRKNYATNHRINKLVIVNPNDKKVVDVIAHRI